MLTPEQILQANDLVETREVAIPEWGGTVYVRKLNAYEWDRWEASTTRRSGKKVVTDLSRGGLRARFAALVLCDETGRRLFRDDQAGQLGTKSAGALDKVWEAGYALNQINVDDTEKNSDETSTASSSDG